jgi:hypothetical protein
VNCSMLAIIDRQRVGRHVATMEQRPARRSWATDRVSTRSRLEAALSGNQAWERRRRNAHAVGLELAGDTLPQFRIRPAFVPRTTGRRQETTRRAEATNPQVRTRIRVSPQVAESGSRTLSR